MTAPIPTPADAPRSALSRRAVLDSLFVSERIFARLGREGAARMARASLIDALDRPLVAQAAALARLTAAMTLARDAGRAFAQAEREGAL